MSSSEEEIRERLEGKPLKSITLPDNVNDLDQGSDSSNVKIGQKNLEANQDLEKRLAWMDYVTERNKKLQYGDQQAIAEYVKQQNEIRERLEDQKYRQRLEWDLLQEEKARLKKESKITDLDRKEEAEDILKLEKKRDREIANLQDYFNCPEEEWQEFLNDHHKPEQSPANVLIGTGTVGFVCELHKYKQTIPVPDGRLATNAFTTEEIEDHIRRHDPEMHKAAIIDSINEKYDKLIQERKEKTLEDKDVVFNKEIRQIEKTKSRVDGDLSSAGTKITKGDRARIRLEEEEENERNRKIYRGLYSQCQLTRKNHKNTNIIEMLMLHHSLRISLQINDVDH